MREVEGKGESQEEGNIVERRGISMKHVTPQLMTPIPVPHKTQTPQPHNYDTLPPTKDPIKITPSPTLSYE